MPVLIKLEAATPSLPPFFIHEPGLAFKMNLHKVMINAGFKYQPKKNRMYVSHQFLHKDGRVVDYNLKTNGWAYDDCGGRGLGSLNRVIGSRKQMTNVPEIPTATDQNEALTDAAIYQVGLAGAA